METAAVGVELYFPCYASQHFSFNIWTFWTCFCKMWNMHSLIGFLWYSNTTWLEQFALLYSTHEPCGQGNARVLWLSPALAVSFFHAGSWCCKGTHRQLHQAQRRAAQVASHLDRTRHPPMATEDNFTDFTAGKGLQQIQDSFTFGTTARACCNPVPAALAQRMFAQSRDVWAQECCLVWGGRACTKAAFKALITQP